MGPQSGTLLRDNLNTAPEGLDLHLRFSKADQFESRFLLSLKQVSGFLTF